MRYMVFFFIFLLHIKAVAVVIIAALKAIAAAISPLFDFSDLSGCVVSLLTADCATLASSELSEEADTTVTLRAWVQV